ncbi:E3 ubiquitin-protein ligase PUB22 [Ricinus communis]|uniref:U-box domain-containing protein n=1 Tax=Ricinus communis TaxID=3988 RepID=B9SBD7_RICCO|nr:E3 ubiquitin-protein ligase PUB22 [Ricinus communis]EEF39022.1 ubiquitin-protein ligase, putative [Ricinus communis]|eukprot:XP_002523306.1 E3 ubiquitin-protein ligase PUB22 [Ricinus communis]
MDNLQLESLDVPSFFICPISLQMMKDPVTICTGMTFDRESIQKWLFSYNHITCPITKQPLSDFSLIPNSNLLRLIQSWQVHDSSYRKSIEQQRQAKHDAFIPLRVVLEEIKQPHLHVKSLRKIKTLICDRTFFTGDDVLYSSVASLIVKSESSITGHDHSSILIDEAVSVLCLLKPSDETLKIVSQNGNGLLIDSLCTIMTKYQYDQPRTQAAVILKSIFKVVDGIYKEGLKADFFESIAEILKDQNSKQGSMAVLTILTEVLQFGKNKEKAIKGGLVPVLVELLAEKNEKPACEMMLFALENLCRKAEGRAAFLAHPMGVAAVLSKILRVSHVGNYKAISLLLWIFRFCKSNEIAEEFMEVGGVAKVFMLVQTGCDSKTQGKAWELLGFHKKIWGKSPCFPSSIRD